MCNFEKQTTFLFQTKADNRTHRILHKSEIHNMNTENQIKKQYDIGYMFFFG